jgi:prevent-host-death family protein
MIGIDAAAVRAVPDELAALRVPVALDDRWRRAATDRVMPWSSKPLKCAQARRGLASPRSDRQRLYGDCDRDHIPASPDPGTEGSRPQAARAGVSHSQMDPPRIIDIYLPSELRIHALINQLIRDTMDHRIDAHTARTQFGQLMDLATRNNERFIVERRGEPAVVIMSVQDFIRTAAPPPDWLQKAWARTKRRGLAAMPLEEIEAEITAHRRSKKGSPHP